MTNTTHTITIDLDWGLDSYVGLRAVHTTYEGERMVGIVERERIGTWEGAPLHSGRLVIRFADGRWAYALHDSLELADNPCIACGETTTVTVLGRVGDDVGVLCEDCQYWCDGNIVY